MRRGAFFWLLKIASAAPSIGFFSQLGNEVSLLDPRTGSCLLHCGWESLWGKINLVPLSSLPAGTFFIAVLTLTVVGRGRRGDYVGFEGSFFPAANYASAVRLRNSWWVCLHVRWRREHSKQECKSAHKSVGKTCPRLKKRKGQKAIWDEIN